MVSPSDLLGRRVGNVRIEALLGVGGMGAVYQGYDEVLERHVAVKSLRWIEEGGRERVLREARILSRLDHPGICRIYDFASDGPRDLLILELVDGESLAQRLVSGRLARDEWLDLGVGMAQALAVAHDAGVVHRDLKPSNVMVTSTGPKVLDFGIARLASEPGIAPGPGVVRPLQVGDDDDATAVLDAPTPATVGLTRTGTVLGTPAYMSPEQARGERVGAPSDVFSLGLILSEMATGTRVFRARDPIKEAREAGSPDLGEVPAELRDLLSAMLDPRPDERPSAAEVVTRLERLKDRPRRRRHIILGLLVSTVVVVLGALTAWSWSR